MKYEEVNWLEWPGSPDKDIFDDWIKARKSKKHPALTHTAMRKYSVHVSKAVEQGICTINEAFEYAAEGGWRAIMYKYLHSAKSRDMELYATYQIESDMKPTKSTRDMSLDDELNDTSWAH